MHGSTLRHLFLGTTVWLATILTSFVSHGSANDSFRPGFRSFPPVTLVQCVSDAHLVLYGSIENAKPGVGDAHGSSDLVIDAVIKDHAILANRKILHIPRYVPQSENRKWLLFGDVLKGQIDWYRGVPVHPDSDMVAYLKGALAFQNKPIAQRLRFTFEYLDNNESEITTDAYKAFLLAKYPDYRSLAAELPPDKLAKWMRDPETQQFRAGLYALLLGHCGQEKHAEMLLATLRDPEKHSNISLMHGVLTGFILLRPEQGWIEITSILGNQNEEFSSRYAALLTLRFLWEQRPDVIAQEKLTEGLMMLLEQIDIADLPINDLRRYQRWEVCDKVLGLQNLKSHEIPFIRRSILRYALSCPKASAVAFVAEYRKRDPEAVKDAEEFLSQETKDTISKALFFF